MILSMLTVWSSKGGVGKTSIALEIASRMKAGIVTNEANSRVPLFEFLKGKYFVLEHEQTISELNLPENIIFDFGGMVDLRVLEAIELSNYILMPVTPSMIDIQKCAEDIEGILTAFKAASAGLKAEEFTEVMDFVLKKFIIIVNKTVMEAEAEAVILQINNILANAGIAFNFKVFIVPESRALKNMHSEIKSIKQMIETANSPILLQRSYRKVNSIFDEIINFINN